jgi:hypothetical protein
MRAKGKDSEYIKRNNQSRIIDWLFRAENAMIVRKPQDDLLI